MKEKTRFLNFGFIRNGTNQNKKTTKVAAHADIVKAIELASIV